MSIPEAAVEAAAEWLPHSGDCEVRPERDCTCWKARVDLMRGALEAAAPHIIAPILALHPKTCEINGDDTDCNEGECPMLVCGPCGETWPCPTVAALQ